MFQKPYRIQGLRAISRGIVVLRRVQKYRQYRHHSERQGTEKYTGSTRVRIDHVQHHVHV